MRQVSLCYAFWLSGLSRYLQVLLRVRNFQRKNWTVPMVFDTYVKKHPNKAAFIFEGKTWTFKDVLSAYSKPCDAFLKCFSLRLTS